MKHPVYAKELQKGDMVNGHEDGWLTVKNIRKLNRTFIEVDFINGTQKTYFSGDKVEAIRR